MIQTFGSVASGIEAATVAFEPLGWRPLWLSEIADFPSALLQRRYPEVHNVGDMTGVRRMIDDGDIDAPDLLCGGCPCQSFSIAGLRGSLDDDRGNLTLEFIRIADAIDRVRRYLRKPPAWVLYENVPGIFSTDDNAFGTFLGGLCGGDAAIDQPGGGWPSSGVVSGPSRVVAWRVLDARFFGVAQRRRRVFVLALGGADRWACADALLPIGESVRRHPPTRRRTREDLAGGAPIVAGGGGRAPGSHADAGVITAGTMTTGMLAYGGNNTAGSIDVATAVRAKGGTGHGDFESETFIAFDPAQMTSKENRSNPKPGDPCHTLTKGGHPPAIAFHGSQDPDVSGDVTHPVGRNQGQETCAMIGASVRRLMPVECERLQGFDDGYTDIPYRGKPHADDGPRYKAIGNSWAVPVVAWIAQRIQQVSGGV